MSCSFTHVSQINGEVHIQDMKARKGVFNLRGSTEEV